MFKKSAPNPTIEFYCSSEVYGSIAEPYPASKNVPQWLKSLPGIIPPASDSQFPGGTIKNCMPVLDAYCAGYIIPLSSPVRFVVRDGNVTTTWKGGDVALVESHNPAQLGEDSGLNPPFLKWVNPWGVKLPEGYSAIFTQPFNQPTDTLFKCMTGLVDCDAYTNNVNFPFVWTGPADYEGIIDAGTPLVQVIPFKREEWAMDVRGATEEETLSAKRIFNLVNTRMYGYRDKFRSTKKWR